MLLVFARSFKSMGPEKGKRHEGAGVTTGREFEEKFARRRWFGVVGL